MLMPVLAGVRKRFPADTSCGFHIRRFASALGLTRSARLNKLYQHYIRSIETSRFVPPIPVSTHSPNPILFSIVIPCFNTPFRYLDQLLQSLQIQTYGHWEAIIADASTDDMIRGTIRERCTVDTRLRYLPLSQNRGISSNTNAALEQVRGAYVVFVDHDDVCSPHALNELAAIIAAAPDTDVLYSDEDVLTDDGRHRIRPFFKPDWSPHLFLEMNYTNHISAIRHRLITQVGGLRPDYDGAQDYDLLLRIQALPTPVKVKHVPKILYHWREAKTSTARRMATKAYAIEAGRRALVSYLSSISVDSQGVDPLPHRPGWYHIHPRQHCSVRVFVDANHNPEKNQQFINNLRSRTRSVWAKPYFTPFPPNGAPRRQYLDDCDVVVLVRDAFLPDDETWLDELSGVLALPHTAVVAPLLQPSPHIILNAGYFRRDDSLHTYYPMAKLDAISITTTPGTVRDVSGLSSKVIAFSASSFQGPSLRETPDIIDSRQWSGRLVFWAHTRFSAV